MWIVDLKIVLSFCVCTALAFSKQDYIKWRERFLPNRPSTTTKSALVNSENDIYENLKLRHQSRFPNLDRVMMKIDSMGNRKYESNLGHNKVRHQGWQHNLYRTTTTSTTTTDEGLFGDDYADTEYEDENSSDDLNEYDDWEDDDEDYLDDYEENEEDPFSDNEWQAEEATEPTVPAPVSSLTKYKWDNYGTRSKVEESRRLQLNLRPSGEQRATHAVVEHYMKVQQEGRCHKPVPKVISVQSEYPDPSKTYTPHCTILHRCAEDTGCCTNYETRCGPVVQVPVHLYFYTKTIGVAETKVEKLTFYNHTECACIETSKSNTPTTENQISRSGLTLRSAAHPEDARRCKCPEEFSPKFRYDSNYCTCDCEEENQDCIRMKKGKEYFSLTDRKCILDGQCGIPICEYGVYLRQLGRCQRKQEKLDSYKKLTIK